MSLPGFPEPLPVGGEARVVSVVDSALERDGELLVLRGNDLALLSPVASAVVMLARATGDGGVAVDYLATTLFEQFGRPVGVDPNVAVRQVLAELSDRGFVEILGA
jgi:hypothetical protein